jgi:DNA-binding GntR family transcriptional regulator
VKARVARHEVRDEIQRRILSGESKPGERLSQQSLARELGVAQGTVRESLLQLQWLGLVESVDHLGMFVDNLDASRICEAYLVREVMEGLAARLACGNAGRANIAELRCMADNIFHLAQEKDNEAASLKVWMFFLNKTRINWRSLMIQSCSERKKESGTYDSFFNT